MKRAVAQVPALERGMKLLAWMAVQEEPVTLTQVARGLGLGIPEVQRPVACLEEIGYLRRAASGAYELSGKLFTLASHHPPLFRLRRAAEPLLTEFARQTGQSIHLSVPDGDAALMILDVPGDGFLRLSLRPGARFEPKNTLSGALLAAGGCITFPTSYVPPAAIVRAVKADCPVSQPSQYADGILDIGILLKDRESHTLGVVTCSAIHPKNKKFRVDALFAAVKQTASKIRETY